jgi:hypothetical protein
MILVLLEQLHTEFSEDLESEIKDELSFLRVSIEICQKRDIKKSF